MHSEPPLDNPRSPQWTTQTATSPPPVAYCYRRGKTLPMPNPHLAASAIKGCARKTGSETMATNARWMEGEGGGSELCQATCVHHLPFPIIHLLTRCHLSLFTYGGGKCADLQPWHFVIVGRKGGQQQGGKKSSTLCRQQQLWKDHLQ